MNEKELYNPKSALVIYEAKTRRSEHKIYVEAFDMDADGYPVNGHPLTQNEALRFSKALNNTNRKNAFLKPAGILPTNVLHFDTSDDGSVTWYTKPELRKILYASGLDLQSGMAQVPALVWQATKRKLKIFAMASGSRPAVSTVLYHAPFFNVGDTGEVCLGTVNVKIKDAISIEDFMREWEGYFFNSNFTHGNRDRSTKDNFFAVWKHQHESGQPFPKEQLVKTSTRIKNLIR